MPRFVAVVALIAGVILLALAASFYSEYARASRVARYFRDNPDEVPVSGSREELISDSLSAAGHRGTRAAMSGLTGLALCAGGAAFIVRARRKSAAEAWPAAGPRANAAELREAVRQWAGVALVPPVDVHYRRLYAVMAVGLVAFFVVAPALSVAANGFTRTTVFVGGLCVGMAAFLGFLQRRARSNAASRFDVSGVTRGDGRRLDWDDYTGVDYLMMLERGGFEESLWRVEVVFAGGVAWIIPGRVGNLDEINALVASIPGPHEKRRA
jgi:hypothetical protein